ncbi:MAG: hypothetical protein H0X51_01420 [Parachlamydiaceae bacterium]|nr:hypothetical protein [Parachlamydiaceae bacterium]
MFGAGISSSVKNVAQSLARESDSTAALGAFLKTLDCSIGTFGGRSYCSVGQGFSDWSLKDIYTVVSFVLHKGKNDELVKVPEEIAEKLKELEVVPSKTNRFTKCMIGIIGSVPVCGSSYNLTFDEKQDAKPVSKPVSQEAHYDKYTQSFFPELDKKIRGKEDSKSA